MSLLQNVKSDSSINDEKDVLGGGGPLDSAIYPGTITMAYLKQTAKKSVAVCLFFKTDDGREVREDLWVQSGEAKGCKNYYEKDGVKNYLPGYNMANSLCLLTVGKELAEMVEETKTVNVYDYDQKKEVPTDVPVLTELLGKEVLAAILQEVVDKNAKADDGSYQPTGETRTQNVFDKFFRASDKRTTAEVLAESEATFHDQWEAKWTGKTKDRTSKDSNVSTGSFGNSGAAAPAQAQKKSLFAN